MKTAQHLAPTIALILGTVSPFIQAATFPTGTRLVITSGVETFDGNGNSLGVTSGSWFGMDQSGNSAISTSEMTDIISAGSGAIVIGSAQAASGSHSAGINGSENPAFDVWEFFGNTGLHYTRSAPSGNTTTGLNLSGWTVTWNAIPTIAMGTGAWQPGNCGAAHMGCSGLTFTNGIAEVTWNGTNGGAFSLWYAATVPAGDISGFGGVRYILRLVGTVQNDAPTAAARTVNALPSTLTSWTPGAADPNPTSGVANSSLTCSIGTAPSTGTATIAANCSSGTYTDTSGATGTDSFTYVVSDGISTATATVTVNVSNDPPPTANDFNASAVATTASTLDFTSSVTDPVGTVDWTTLSVTCDSGAVIVNNNDGTVDYTSPANFAGVDGCDYAVNDDNGGTSSTATASVSVYTDAVGVGSGTLTGGSTNTVPADSNVGSQCVGGCLDFTVSGVTTGSTVQVVLPLSTPVPADAVVRKYINGAWENFSNANGNSYASAARTTVLGQSVCPPAGSASYVAGTLNTGDECLQIAIVDGGSYDSDATPGQVADPTGLATPTALTAAGSGSSGCTLASRPASLGAGGDWLLLGAALAGLGLIRRRVS